MTRVEPRPPRLPRPSRALVLYGIIGVSGVTLDYLVFLLLFNTFGLHEQLANAISTSVGIANNFALNAWLNFRTSDRLLIRFARFYSVGLAGMALTFLLLHLGSGMLGLTPNLVKAAAIPLVVVLQYLINKRWSFG
ncbi:GtrA family protein [Saccharopolyspora sp. NFXS83]|uniref:GtrA family protein n=1 Tax=Saccharopolyspora sp. NFXS83 TaxID=2993560 RepID=UPI00224B0451|nr:GtrA family protein [Saccharopolyspora sp. NFXS83]MCX2732474.1 GtrA family protein [Saccharopolyspora sp. NFXS83]